MVTIKNWTEKNLHIQECFHRVDRKAYCDALAMLNPRHPNNRLYMELYHRWEYILDKNNLR